MLNYRSRRDKAEDRGVCAPKRRTYTDVTYPTEYPPTTQETSMTRGLVYGLIFWTAAAFSAVGQDYKVEKVDAPAAVGQVAPEIAALLNPTGFKISKGGQALCEIWLAKEWPIASEATTSPEILYPLTLGQLMGVAR